jgi:pheromone shutdown protein TraB
MERPGFSPAGELWRQLIRSEAPGCVAFELQPERYVHGAAGATNRRMCIARAMRGRSAAMLETIAIILIVLWLLGMVSGYTLGNFIWVLLVIAVVLFLVRLVSGRRVV